MKKSKRLLSVLLAMLLILSSMSVMASAAKISYQTVEDLGENGLNAYSPYGAVTRLNTEERLSILFDYLDNVLGAIPNATMSAPVIGDIKYGSVNELLQTIDSVTSNSTIKFAIGIATSSNTLSYIKFDSWKSGMSREKTPHETIVYELLELISANAPAVEKIIKEGALNLGLIGTILKNFVDLNSVNKMVAELPLLVKGFIFPLFERWDDSQALISTYSDTAGSMESVLNGFVQRLFTNDMSITSYKEDAAGNCISNHTLPEVGVLDDATNGTRHYFTKGTDETGEYILRNVYNTETGAYESANADTGEAYKYYKTEELDAEGNGTGEFVFVKTNEDGTEENLKYYKNDSQFLPSFAADLASGTKTLDLTTQKPAELLYMFIPYVFAEMAPVVLNGSVKKLLAEWFGASFTEVGAVTSDAVKGLAGYNADLPIFAAEQGKYLWEWSDYAVLSDGTHVWRFEDSIYVADTTNANPYFDIINWNYKVTDDFMNEFIPGADGKTPSDVGYTTILQGLNKFLIKVANLVLDKDLVARMNLIDGDNSNLVENIKKAAQTIVAVSPESLFGSNYADPDRYYNLMMSNNNQEVLLGIACTVIDLLMPQMILPTADKLAGKGYSVAAVLAAVVREIATQLVPNINYDALIYADYNTKTFLTGKDNSYWLDVALTIGTDIGFKYLTALSDMGEDDKVAFAGANWNESRTYTASDMDAVVGKDGAVKLWEQRVDYIIDWALTTGAEYGWKFDRLVNCGATIDLATAQDPWVKLGNILKSVLPIADVFNIDTNSETWLETLLRDDFVLALLDLEVTKIVGGATANGVLNIPTASILRTTNTMSAVVVVIRDLLNNLLYKVAGNANLIDPAVITGIDSLLGSNTTNDRKNMATVVRSLLQKLFAAYGKGLLDPVMPILGFFVGWTTDAQKFSQPTINFSHPGNRAYIYSADGKTATTTINVRNDASGMLEKHRNSSVVDSSYILYIDSITSNDDSMQVTVPTEPIMPGGKLPIPVTLTYTGEKVIRFVVKYHLIGKDGSPIGGTQTKVAYAFVSSTLSDAELKHLYSSEDGNKNYSGIDQFYYKVFTKDVYKTITGYAQTIYYKKGGTNPNLGQMPEVNSVVAPTGIAATYFKHISAPITNYGWENKLTKDIGSSTGNLYLAQDGVTEKTKFPYGTYDMGAIAIKYWRTKIGGSEGDPKVWDIDFIYYNDHDITSVMNEYVGKNVDISMIDDSQASAVTAYNEYITALETVVQLATLPKMEATYVDLCNTQMEGAIKTLQSAYKTLSQYLKIVDSRDVLSNALTTCEPGGDVPEINYQDYNLYEYFNYQDERTAVRNRLNEYVQPAAPEKYIDGCALTAAEIDALVAAEPNAKKAFAIDATVLQPTEEELAAYKEALAAWTLPSYSLIENEDKAYNLVYYKQFLIANTTNKQFLAKEIAYAEAQNYDGSKYSKDSWDAYTSALAVAKEVQANDKALQSAVFDAKYELMKAENELLLKEKSAKENGALKELQGLVAEANTIFDNPADYTVVDGVSEKEAYAALIKALGYDYNGEILYSHSALSFLAYDRETTDSNLKRIAAAADALAAAIANFKSTIEIIVKDTNIGGKVDAANQFVYGVKPGDVAANYFKATNDVPLTWEAANAASSENGTGATATLLNAKGQVVATYTLIIFGDVNGDGAVDAFDAALINMHLADTSKLEGAYAFAGDTNGDQEIDDIADYAAVVNQTIGAAEISQDR